MKKNSNSFYSTITGMARYVMAFIFMLSSFSVLGATGEGTPSAYDMRYEKGHLLMQKGGEVNVIDFDLEWPNIVDGQNVAKLRRYIARHLFQTDGDRLTDVRDHFLRQFGTPVTHQFDSIPDDDKFCYVTLALRNLYTVPGRFISFMMSAVVEPGPKSSQQARVWDCHITYDITRDTVLTVRDLFRESGRCRWRDGAWNFKLDLNSDQYISMQVPEGCMAASDEMLLYTVQWENDVQKDRFMPQVYSVMCSTDKLRGLLSKDARYLIGNKLWPIHPQMVSDSILGYTMAKPVATHSGGGRPHFVMGDDSLSAYIGRNLRYPVDELKRQVEGTVVVRFLVDSVGSVREPRVVQPLSPACDREAVRVINMTRWRPAAVAGCAVNVVCVMPIQFKLR